MKTPEFELIGLAINHKQFIPDLISLDREVFCGPDAPLFYDAIKKLFNQEQDVNEYSVAQHIIDSGRIDQDSALTMIADAIITSGDERTYESVKKHLTDKKIKLELESVLSESISQIKKGVPAEMVSDTVISTLVNMSEKMNHKNGMTSIKDASRIFFERLEKTDTGQTERIKTGLKSLDKHLGGIESPDVVYIAARPSMGKTSLATEFLNSISCSDKEKDNLIFSLETSLSRIAEKIHCQRTRIYQSKFTNGGLTQEDWDKLARSDTETSLYNNMHINDRTDITASDVMAECIKHDAKKKVGSIFLDYLQLLKAPPGQWSREREVAEQSRIMKIMAKRLQCPAFVLSQLNRSLENRSDKVPVMSDLRDSGSIEQDADVIIFIYRDEVYTRDDSKEKGKARIIIAKNKRGRTGSVTVGWDGSTTKFYDL